MQTIQTEHGSVGPLLGLLVLIIALYVGHQLWLKHKGAGILEAPTTASMPIQHAPRLTDEQVHLELAPTPQPVHIPTSPYAAMLTDVSQMIEQGKLQDAQLKLQALAPDALTDMAIRLNVATLWNNLGVHHAQAAGTMGAGAFAYKTAVSINPRNSAAYMNMVLAYWELKDPALTTEMLEEAMRIAPEHAMPHLILAQRFIEKDELLNATTHLEHAKAHSADSQQAQSFLNSQIAYIEKARKAEQNFHARDSSHFTVKYDGGEDYAVWTRVLEILEDAYRDIGQQLGHYPSKPILVVLHTRQSFHNATGGPAWSDGLYDPSLGRIKVPTQGALTDQAWLTRVLRHEFVHALLDDRLQGHRIPQWLNEGLAMQLAGDAPPDIPAFIRGEVTLINLTHLEGSWGGLPAQYAMVAYLEGNSATRYLIDRYGMGTVRDLLDRLSKGEAFPAAFHDRVFITYDDFQRRWVDTLNLSLQGGRT
jgi:predicted negative regulator of RcsB-dependent stress response